MTGKSVERERGCHKADGWCSLFIRQTSTFFPLFIFLFCSMVLSLGCTLTPICTISTKAIFPFRLPPYSFRGANSQ